MAEKNYVGKGWEKKFDNGGANIRLSLEIEKLKALPVDKYGCVKVDVVQRREVDAKSGATHFVAENTWQPGDKPEAPKMNNADLPF